MKLTNTIILAAAMLAIGAVASALPETNSPLRGLSDPTAQGAQRTCIYPSGGWTIINCSNAAAASSAALTQWTRYVMQCGDDSRWATGTAATGQDADANDGYLPAGAYMDFMTTDTLLHMSCLNINSDSDCRIIECR